MYRLAYTETTLLFFYYLDNIVRNKGLYKYYKESQANLINWLYSTSGFYDIAIKGSYFDFDVNRCRSSFVYNTYMSKLLKKVKKYDKGCQLNLHVTAPEFLDKYYQSFVDYINKRSSYNERVVDKEMIFNFIQGKKRILVVNDIASLFVQQWENGNLKKIFDDFPDLEIFKGYNPGTTFFNRGPHGSILQSIRKHCKKISKLIDEHGIQGVVISCGAYTPFLADFIYQKKKVDVQCTGGHIAENFGVANGRASGRILCKTNSPELWITVPDEMKPKYHEKVEWGQYW
jgi:hypothetical protein